MNTIQEIQSAFYNGAFQIPYPNKIPVPKDGVVDAERSVRWNRDEFERIKNSNSEAVSIWRIELSKQEVLMRSAIAGAISNEYGLSHVQSAQVESFVFEKYHSIMSDYFSNISEYAYFAKRISEASRL